MNALIDRLQKPRSATSWVWKFFRKYPAEMIFSDKKKESHAICIICLSNRGAKVEETELKLMLHSEVNYGKNTDPKKLEQHLRSFHKNVLTEHIASIAREKGQACDFMERFVVKHPDYQGKHCEWICRTLQPINTCDNPSYRAMIATLSASASIKINRQSLRKEIVETAAEFKEKYIQLLSKTEWIAFTTDHWTSCANESFMALSAHFFDSDWELFTLTLMCDERHGTATAADIKRELDEALRDYCIPATKVAAFVTDTAPVMVATGRILLGDLNIT